MNNTKTVYFLRHGESVANATGVRLGDTPPLTDRGKAQAREAGRRLATLPIERVIVSPYLRTRETFAEIAEHFPDVTVDHSTLVVERTNPSIMLGKSMGDEAIGRIWKEIGANYHVLGWRYSDEENFEDLRGRAAAAFEFLAELPEQNILVVTHGMFMKMLLAYTLLGESLDARTFWDQFIPTKNVMNTALMTVEYGERYGGGGNYWKLISWNDHAHLENKDGLINHRRVSLPHG